MKTILIITVGGSHEPIVASAKQDGPNKPDFVHFLCSADSGKTKGSYIQVEGLGAVNKSHFSKPQPDLPNIVTLARLSKAQYNIHKIEHFDNLDECYLSSLHLMEDLHRKHPEAGLVADYTGGTKSMTAGLAAAALDDGSCEIRLVAGLRQDREKVTGGTEFVRPVQVWNAQVKRRMMAAQSLTSRFDYIGAAHVLEETAACFAGEDTVTKLQRWLSLCRAFNAWDRFDHKAAHSLLQPYRARFIPWAIFLDAVVNEKGHGFELVEDLLLNAKRRATQGRFDDAVGRLYRALELTAQQWLRERHGINTGDVNNMAAPEAMRQRLERERNGSGVIQIGLLLAWDMIGGFPDDPLGQRFNVQRSRLLDFLAVRNESLFAHGLRSVNEHDYKSRGDFVDGFLHEAIDAAVAALGKKRGIVLQQLPTEWE